MNKYKLRHLCEGMESGPVKSNIEGNLPRLWVWGRWRGRCVFGGGGGRVVRVDFPEEITWELKPEGQAGAI